MNTSTINAADMSPGREPEPAETKPQFHWYHRPEVDSNDRVLALCRNHAAVVGAWGFRPGAGQLELPDEPTCCCMCQFPNTFNELADCKCHLVKRLFCPVHGR